MGAVERMNPAMVTVCGVVLEMVKDEDGLSHAGVGGVQIYTEESGDSGALTCTAPSGEFSMSDLVRDSNSLTVFFKKAGYEFEPITLDVHPCTTKQEIRVLVKPL